MDEALLVRALQGVGGLCDQVHGVGRTELTERVADGARLARRFSRGSDPTRLGRPEVVIVTASATEFRPTEFAVSVRLRPTGGDENGGPVDLTCVVALENAAGSPLELGTVVRDELIALQHAAQYMN